MSNKSLKSLIHRVLDVTFMGLSLCPMAFGVTIAADENGNGSIDGTSLPHRIENNLLIYTLPFVGTPGDVVVRDFETGQRSDLIRFNGNSTLTFYSDTTDGVDSLADAGIPTPNLSNFEIAIEFGVEGFNTFEYAPSAGMPGYDSNFLPTYSFVSDGEIPPMPMPEPSSLALLPLGLAVVLRFARNRRQCTKILAS